MAGGVREALPDVLEWIGKPLFSPEVVGSPSRMSGSSREALPDVRDLSGGCLGSLGVVGRPSRMSVSGWEGDGGRWNTRKSLCQSNPRRMGPRMVT